MRKSREKTIDTVWELSAIRKGGTQCRWRAWSLARGLTVLSLPGLTLSEVYFRCYSLNSIITVLNLCKCDDDRSTVRLSADSHWYSGKPREEITPTRKSLLTLISFRVARIQTNYSKLHSRETESSLMSATFKLLNYSSRTTR